MSDVEWFSRVQFEWFQKHRRAVFLGIGAMFAAWLIAIGILLLVENRNDAGGEPCFTDSRADILASIAEVPGAAEAASLPPCDADYDVWALANEPGRP